MGNKFNWMFLAATLMLPGIAGAEIVPAEGQWFNRSEPGSGLTIERQGDILAVTVYTYDEDGLPIWGQATGSYQGGEIFEAPLLAFQGGSPLESSSFSSAEVGNQRNIRLRFFGDVYASLSIDGSEPQPIVPLQFGWHPQGVNIVSPFEEVNYLIPDIDAAWYLVPRDFESDYAIRFEGNGVSLFLDPIPEHHPLEGIIPAFKYATGELTNFDCDTTARTPELPDACRMPAQDAVSMEGKPGRYMFPVSGIDWHVWRGRLYFREPGDPVSREEFSEPQPLSRQFVVNRLGISAYEVFDGDFESPGHSFAPSDGMWWNPDRPGSGLVLEMKESVLAVTLFTYDANGDPIWYLASGNMETPRRFSGEILEFGEGKPIASRDVAHFQPEIVNSREIAIDFHSANFATVAIGNGESFEIQAINFGHQSSPRVQLRRGDGSLADRTFPDLTGYWAFAALNPEVDRTVSLMIAPPVNQQGSFHFPAVDRSDGEYRVECSKRGPDPKCFVRNLTNGEQILRFRAGNIGKDRMIGDYAGPGGAFNESSRKAWGFRIEQPH